MRRRRVVESLRSPRAVCTAPFDRACSESVRAALAVWPGADGRSGRQWRTKLEFPPDYAKRMSRWQRRAIARRLPAARRDEPRRRELRKFYDTELARAGLPILEIPPYADPVLLRYPARVADKPGLLAAAQAARVEVGDWFDHPLHPAGLDLEPLGWRTGVCLQGERAAAEVINLPMHARVKPADARRAVELARAFR